MGRAWTLAHRLGKLECRREGASSSIVVIKQSLKKSCDFGGPPFEIWTFGAMISGCPPNDCDVFDAFLPVKWLRRVRHIFCVSVEHVAVTMVASSTMAPDAQCLSIEFKPGFVTPHRLTLQVGPASTSLVQMSMSDRLTLITTSPSVLGGEILGFGQCAFHSFNLCNSFIIARTSSFTRQFLFGNIFGIFGSYCFTGRHCWWRCICICSFTGRIHPMFSRQ